MKLINTKILNNNHYNFPDNITYQPIFILLTLTLLYIPNKLLPNSHINILYRTQKMKFNIYSVF